MNRNIPLILLVVLLTLGTTRLEIRAETRYVSEEFEITLRTGPGADRKIIALIRSGTAVKILDSGEEWTKIRHNNKNGWVLTRYLSSEKPCAMTLVELEENYTELKNETQNLRQKTTDLEAENQRLQDALSTRQNNLEQLNSDYEKLQRESSDFLKLKEQYEQTSKELAITKAKFETADKKNQQLIKNQNYKWVMVGAGVLTLGFIIGYSSRRQRRQSSLLG